MISKSFFLAFTRILLVCVFFISCNPVNSKKERNFVTLLSLVSLQNRCNPNNGSFWARNLTLSSQSSYCVYSTLVASSANMNLYVENGLSTNLNYTDVASAFESNIFPVEKSAFGAPSDINGDGKITVLILDIKDGATASSGFVAGFVDPASFFTDSPLFSIRSNQREILFMDGVELLRLRDKDLSNGKPDIFLSTLAHELQHLIRFQYSEGGDDTWIDEGTSEVSSDLTGYGPQNSRLSCFRGDASSSCTGGIGSTSSGSPSLFAWSSNLKNYAYAYSFMKYMYTSSGTNATDRNAFFSNTVQGLNGTRADNAYNFMTLFMNSTNFNPTVLSSDNKTAFKRIFASFLGQSVGYNLQNVYFGNTSVTNIDSVRTTYPFPSELLALSTPSPFSAISNSASINLSPSQVSRISGTTSGITSSSSDFVIVKGTNEFLIFNGDNIGSTTSNSSASFDMFETIQYPELNLNTGSEIICPNEHLIKMNNIDKVRYNLKLYKREN